ncbi:hypothetical protein [Sedimenticola selenatireducens]|uniref:hypothetical protein n=1 Tax=Sedimenticola selenatireducens TaxID=191960 RepID=UPI002AAC0324|nr:hypothetical protein [Sedimenticola selenatireducens]
MMLVGKLYEKYLDVLDHHNGNFSMKEPLPEKLKISESGRLSIFYAPFDSVNTKARVVLVGITPGLQQAVNALNAAKQEIDRGVGTLEVVVTAKATASFSGTMRSPLIEMLDHVGLNTALGITSCAALFSDRQDLLHSTSILRYPVFYDGKNYSGSPNMLKTPLLRAALEARFSEEALMLPDAVYVPLGPKVSEGLQHLANKGILNEGHILSGIPHPSGANAERIKYFLGRKSADRLSVKTNPAKIDIAKTALLAKIHKLSLSY